MTERRPSGFAMLTTLWVLAVAAAITLGFAASGRAAIDAGRNRVSHDRAQWTTLGCARTVQSAADAALSGAASPAEALRAWIDLPAVAAAGRFDARCNIAMEAAGTRLDLNAVTEEMVGRLLAVMGVSDNDAEVAVSAFSARRAEGEFSSAAELRRVRAFPAASVETMFSADAGRVYLGAASREVLSSVPGITGETADTIAQRAVSGAPIADLSDVLAAVSETARDELMARYPDAVRLTTPIPDAWVVRVTSAFGDPPVTATVRWLVRRAARRVIITESKVVP